MISEKYKIERAVALKPGLLEPNPWNPNTMNTRTEEALKESLDWVGQVEEVLVRPHPDKPGRYQIINGEHRWTQMQDEEVIYANIIHGLSDAEAKKLTVVMDSTRGEMDKIDLSKLLAEIQVDMGADTITAIPFTENELMELVKLSEANWGNYGGQSDFQDAFSTHQQNKQQRIEAEQRIGGGEPEGGIRSTFQGQQGEFGGQDEVEAGDYVSVFFKAPREDIGIIKQAYQLIQQEQELDENPALAWGMVIVRMAKEFIGHPAS